MDSTQTRLLTVKENVPIWRAPWLLIFLAAVAVHLPSLGGDFVFDDKPAVVENPNAQAPLNLEGVLTETYWGKRSGFEHIAIYRPLVTLSFVGNSLVSPGNVVGYRWVNLILHGLVAVLVLVLFRRFLSPRLAFASALVFAVHSVHVDAVVPIANRTELLSALFGLGTLLCFFVGRERKERQLLWLCGSLVSYSLALGSKESAVMIPVLLLAFFGVERLRNKRDVGRFSTLWLAASALLTVGYLAWRVSILEDPFGGATPWEDNPIRGAEGWARWLTPFHLVHLSAELLLLPLQLSADYTHAVIPLSSASDLPAWIGVAIAVAVVALFRRELSPRGTMAGVFALLLFVFPYGLVSNVVFPSTVLFAERLLYFPSIGAILFGAVCFEARSVPRWASLLLGLWVLLLCMVTWERSADWTSEGRLFERSLEARPGSARLHTNVGHIALEGGDFKKALMHTDEALKVSPESAEALVNRGAIAEALGEMEAADHFFERATKALDGKYGLAHVNLCGLRVRAGRFAEAEESCMLGARLRSDLAPAWVQRGLFLEGVGRLKEAEESFRQGIRRSPNEVATWNALGGFFQRRGRSGDMLEVLYQVYALSPNQPGLSQTLAGLTAREIERALEQGDIPRATVLRERAQKVFPISPTP